METLTRKYGPWKEIEIDGIKALARRQKDAPSFAKWEIVEAQTKLSLMPPSWPGGLSAGTLEGAKHIVQQEVIDKQGKEKILQRIKEAIAKSSPATKEPWEMSQAEYTKSQIGSRYTDSMERVVFHSGREHEVRVDKYIHEARVTRALLEGKTIPVEVIREYPDIRQKILLRYGQAFEDWTSNKAYLDNAGNYRIKREGFQSGGIALWNKLIKKDFPKNEDFHKAAHVLYPHPMEVEGFSSKPQLQSRNKKILVQTELGIKLDKARLAKRILPRTKAGLARHKKHPNRYDIRGMDTPSTSVIRKR